MNPTELIRSVDHAAAMDDRWLFIASLVGCGLFAWVVMRYFVRQHESLIADHKSAREEYQRSLRSIVGEQSAANAKLVISLDNNTKALEECREEIRFSRHERNQMKQGVKGGVVGLALLGVVVGCGTLDKAYRKEVTWTNAPVVQVFTNTVVVTNTAVEVVVRTNTVLVTNELGIVTGYLERVPVRTNVVTRVETNLVPVYSTNLVRVPVTNLVARPEVVGTIEAGGAVVNTFAPGVGSILGLALAGVYHMYRQARNRKVNEVLVQGIETARAVLTTTPQGQAADAELVAWLKAHQRGAGVIGAVSDLVEAYVDNPAARLTAQQIEERLARARTRVES